jgi:dipeptidase D
MEIDKGRANANVLLGRVLEMLREKMDAALVEIQGGVKENVIPKEAMAKILIPAEETAQLTEVVNEFQQMMSSEFGTADPDITLKLTVGAEEEKEVLTCEAFAKVITALNVLPNGIQTMSMDLPGLVETSLNLGVMSVESDKFVVHLSVRSSVPSAKQQVVKQITLLTEVLGGTVELQGDYPGWEFVRESNFRDKCVEIFKAQYGYEPKVETIHAGLECGLFTAKVPGLDCISIGPEMLDIHTPMERVEIKSVERVWEYIKAVMAAK